MAMTMTTTAWSRRSRSATDNPWTRTRFCFLFGEFSLWRALSVWILSSYKRGHSVDLCNALTPHELRSSPPACPYRVGECVQKR